MIRNVKNDKRYIGQSVNIDRRWKDHIHLLEENMHYNSHLQNAWNKYGKENFEFSIIEECNIEDLDRLEIYYIDFYKSIDQNFGYNLTGGGDGTSIVRDEVKQKQSEGIKKYYEDHPEARELSRQRTLKQFEDPEFYRRYRELRSSKEYREKISTSHLGLRPPQKAIDAIREINSKPVLCVETGIIYPSATEAERSLPGNKNIKAVACGQRKTAGGFHWKYVDKTQLLCNGVQMTTDTLIQKY